ncbi:MAG TPA: hypothetical protein PKD70_13165 [Saprospiraceae bacterium]|nr:hypothetical protein [Saprospiraceae bacterium]HMP14822.1 hypothetical protein [Saprospiraceae bacterium]
MSAERKRVLITVATYPLPSRTYEELVCTAGFLEDGSWIRIYPVPLSFISGLRNSGITESYKYNWIELDLRKRTDDFRPESYSPVNYDFRDISLGDKIDTKNAWEERRKICLTEVFTNLERLINLSRAPNDKSLAVFKPAKITNFEYEETDREWKKEWREQLKQLELFATDSQHKKQRIKKLPYNFYYKFEDDQGRQSRLMIEDWEIGALYWNCLRDAKGNEKQALEKVQQKYWEKFSEKDIYLFLGTTKQWHARRAPNPFVIIGVFYPPHVSQLSLF